MRHNRSWRCEPGRLGSLDNRGFRVEACCRCWFGCRGVLEQASKDALPCRALAHVSTLAHAKGKLRFRFAGKLLPKVNGERKGDDVRLRRRGSLNGGNDLLSSAAARSGAVGRTASTFPMAVEPFAGAGVSGE